MYRRLYFVKKLNAPNDPVVTQLAEAITERAVAKGAVVLDQLPPMHMSWNSPPVLIIAIGGDGTMLEAMRLSAHSGYDCIGINRGRIGFLTDLSDPVNSIEKLMWFDRKSWVEERITLEALVKERSPLEAMGCNEVSVSRQEPDTTLTYQLIVDGMDAGVHRANAVMVATPTGSTAYSLSAGGALMLPSIKALQITAVAPMTLTARPIIVSSDSTVQIRVMSEDAQVRVDGQLLDTVSGDDTIVVSTGPSARVVHMEGWNFFSTLSEKLGWIRS